MRALACLALVLSSSTALAEVASDRPQCAKDGETVPVKSHVERRGNDRVVVLDYAIVVCGHPPRPSVAYVVTAKSINYEWETLQQDFLPAILRSIAKGPF